MKNICKSSSEMKSALVILAVTIAIVWFAVLPFLHKRDLVFLKKNYPGGRIEMVQSRGWHPCPATPLRSYSVHVGSEVIAVDF